MTNTLKMLGTAIIVALLVATLAAPASANHEPPVFERGCDEFVLQFVAGAGADVLPAKLCGQAQKDI